jgi:hypothetical protein
MVELHANLAHGEPPAQHVIEDFVFAAFDVQLEQVDVAVSEAEGGVRHAFCGHHQGCAFSGLGEP